MRGSVHTVIRWLGLAMVGGVALSATPGVAAPRPTVFGGGVLARDDSGYLGATVPFVSLGGASSLAVRATISASRYAYTSDTLGRIDGRETRGDVSLLYQLAYPDAYVDAGIGVRLVHTGLSPNDPGNSRRGDETEAVASASGQRTLQAWRVAGFASYGFKIRDYYARAELTRAIAPKLRLGGELTAEGDRTYDRVRYGALLAVTGDPNWEIQFSAGAQEQTHRSGGYAGIAFRRSF